MTPPEPDDFQRLCDAVHDGLATPEEMHRLEHLVVTSNECRRRYAELCELGAALSILGEMGRPRPALRTTIPAGAEGAGRWWQMRLASRLGVAATCSFVVASALATALLLNLFATRHPEDFATLTGTQSTRWESASAPTESGTRLRSCRLRLAEGLASVRFDCGATVELEGPADFELLTPARCRLFAGKLVTTVDAGLKGFVVETPDAVVTDQGTSFGVTVSATDGTLVGVFDGRVDVKHISTGQERSLLENSTVRLSGANVESLDATEMTSFTRNPAKADATGVRLVQISTAVGAGSDHWIQRDERLRSGSDTLLLVKSAVRNLSEYDRKAYLRFDLSGIEQKRLAKATLQLAAAPSGLGFAALISDCTFAVYAVMDDSADDWEPDTLNWTNAPANDGSSSAMDVGQARLLGRFTMAQGQQTGQLTVEGKSLLDVLQTDSNRLVTMAIVRETEESESNALVHGFAGRLHPTLPPPTLRLWIGE